ncbi:MAG: hypothetical protein WBK26_16810 [Burkholderiaceae bacterium]
MPHYFDEFGVLSADPIPGRSTDVAPPDTPLPTGFVWRWEGYDWAPFDPTPPAAPPAPAQTRHIAVGSFFDRFGAHKWPILADTNPVVQALIKDCSVRKHINLDDPQLPAGLGLLVEAGHAIDVQAIVTAPVQDGERP